MEDKEKSEKLINLDLYKKLNVINEGEKIKVILCGKLYMCWRIEDHVAQRVAIVQLYKTGEANREELTKAFDVHINTVNNYINIFEKEGMIGLIDQRRGPKSQWKITPEVKYKILEIGFSNKNITAEGVANLLKNKWRITVSIEVIRQVLIENGLFNLETEKQNIPVFEDLFETRKEDVLLFEEWNNTEKTITNEFTSNHVPEHRVKKTNENKTIKEECLESRKSSYSAAERIYLNRLEKGEYSTYAGGLLFVPLLNEYNFLTTIKKVIDIETYKGYTLEQFCLTLLYYDIFGFRSIENFKTVYPEEFGILLGKLYSPDIRTIRRFLHTIRKLQKGEKLIEEFAKEYLKKGLVKWGVLYIDSHFLPYYGVYIISMGWHGVRQMPMKGSYNFMAIDEKFNPLIFFIRSSTEDLVKKIPELIQKAKKISKEAGLPEEKIIVVFDREGYSAELFRELNKEEYKTTFITWSKYFDSWQPSIKEEQFTKNVTIKYEIQKSEEIKYFETEDRIMRKYGKIRTIVIQSGRKKKQAAIYTNGRELEVSIIIQLICRRWGQETLFKTLRLDHRLDYFPGYVFEELKEQPLVDNPQVKELKKNKIELKHNLQKLKAEFANTILDTKSDEINWQEIKEKKIKILADIQIIKGKILLIDLEISTLPPEIKFDEAHQGVKLCVIDYEKKRFLDCIKIYCYIIQKKMCEILSKYYDNPKDIWTILAMIVRRGTEVKLERNILTIRFKKFTNEVVEYAARHLCEELNNMTPITLDKFSFKLKYMVE